MAIKTQSIDPSSGIYGRSVSWNSGDGDFVNDDILDIERSFGRPGRSTTVEVLAASSCSFRINSLRRRIPLHDDGKKLSLPILDMSNETTWTYEGAPSFDLTSGEIQTFDEPISSIEFTALSGTVIVKSR